MYDEKLERAARRTMERLFEKDLDTINKELLEEGVLPITCPAGCCEVVGFTEVGRTVNGLIIGVSSRPVKERCH